MDWEFFGVIMTLTSAATILMVAGALTRRLGGGKPKSSLPPPAASDTSQDERLADALSSVEDRLARLEDRLEFNERLLQGRTGEDTAPQRPPSED